MKTVNQPYCQAFTRFFIKLFNHFSKIPNEEIPKRHENTLGFDNKGEPYETIKHSVDFHALVDKLIESLKGWPEYKELRKNLILVDAAGNKFKDKDDFHLNNNFISSIAYELFYENELSFKCKAKQVRAKYQLIENGIYQDTWLYAAKSPLYNLELESKKIKLDEDFSINKISKVDLEMLFRTSVSSLGNIPPAYSHGIKTILTLKVPKRKGERGHFPPLRTRELFTNVAASLSIFKRSPVSLGPIYLLPKDFWMIFQGVQFSGLRPHSRFPWRTVELKKQEVPSYRAFWKRLKQSSKSHRWLAIAYERLVEYHFEESSLQDRIIDIMIMFEILYLAGVEGELKFRLSSTCSKLLGQTRPQREKIYNRMRLAYDIRSSVVHSGKIGSKLEKRLITAGLQLPGLISKLEGYLYDSFNVFIKNPEKRETLDMLLLS